jgi:hypothetical protein
MRRGYNLSPKQQSRLTCYLAHQPFLKAFTASNSGSAPCFLVTLGETLQSWSEKLADVALHAQ